MVKTSMMAAGLPGRLASAAEPHSCCVVWMPQGGLATDRRAGAALPCRTMPVLTSCHLSVIILSRAEQGLHPPHLGSISGASPGRMPLSTPELPLAPLSGVALSRQVNPKHSGCSEQCLPMSCRAAGPRY